MSMRMLFPHQISFNCYMLARSAGFRRVLRGPITCGRFCPLLPQRWHPSLGLVVDNLDPVRT